MIKEANSKWKRILIQKDTNKKEMRKGRKKQNNRRSNREGNEVGICKMKVNL